jgi:hypothetical protein
MSRQKIWQALNPGAASPTRVGDRRRREGAVLGLVMMIMIAVGLLGAAAIQIGTADSVETVRLTQHGQSFWLAESGLHDALHRLATDSWLRDSISRDAGHPSRLGPVAYGSGAYEAAIWRGPAGNANSNVYYITASGSVQGDQRTVEQSALIYPEGYEMPFYSNAITANRLIINNNVVVEGMVSCFSSNIHGGGAYAFLTPPLTPPRLDTSEYDLLIQNAAANGAPPGALTNLAGQSHYIRGDISLQNVTGPGTVVASGTITFDETKGTIGPDIRFIAGDQIEFKQGYAVGTNCLLYATTGIRINQGGTVINQSIMLTPGSITARQSFQFSGIIYAGLALDIRQGADIRGVVVSGGMGSLNTELDLKNGVNVTYDPNALPSAPPPGLGGVYVVRYAWREVFN